MVQEVPLTLAQVGRAIAGRVAAAILVLAAPPMPGPMGLAMPVQEDQRILVRVGLHMLG